MFMKTFQRIMKIGKNLQNNLFMDQQLIEKHKVQKIIFKTVHMQMMELKLIIWLAYLLIYKFQIFYIINIK